MLCGMLTAGISDLRRFERRRASAELTRTFQTLLLRRLVGILPSRRTRWSGPLGNFVLHSYGQLRSSTRILPASTFGIASHRPGNGKPAAREILTRRPHPLFFPSSTFMAFPRVGCSTNTNQRLLFFANYRPLANLRSTCRFSDFYITRWLESILI